MGWALLVRGTGFPEPSFRTRDVPPLFFLDTFSMKKLLIKLLLSVILLLLWIHSLFNKKSNFIFLFCLDAMTRDKKVNKSSPKSI